MALVKKAKVLEPKIYYTFHVLNDHLATIFLVKQNSSITICAQTKSFFSVSKRHLALKTSWENVFI